MADPVPSHAVGSHAIRRSDWARLVVRRRLPVPRSEIDALPARPQHLPRSRHDHGRA